MDTMHQGLEDLHKTVEELPPDERPQAIAFIRGYLAGLQSKLELGGNG